MTIPVLETFLMSTGPTSGPDDSTTTVITSGIISARLILQAGPGGDFLNGSSGDDVLNGGAGDDLIEGMQGDDTLEGNAGTDVLSYYHSDAPVTVNLGSQGTAQNVGGSAGTDTFTGFENIYGSNAGNDSLGNGDSLVGNGRENRILGYDGDDIIRGGGGNDDLLGMKGNDFLAGGRWK
ncbi:MAG: hypothetical protein V7775_12615 [Sulfitobacter sp.]